MTQDRLLIFPFLFIIRLVINHKYIWFCVEYCCWKNIIIRVYFSPEEHIFYFCFCRKVVTFLVTCNQESFLFINQPTLYTYLKRYTIKKNEREKLSEELIVHQKVRPDKSSDKCLKVGWQCWLTWSKNRSIYWIILKFWSREEPTNLSISKHFRGKHRITKKVHYLSSAFVFPLVIGQTKQLR